MGYIAETISTYPQFRTHLKCHQRGETSLPDGFESIATDDNNKDDEDQMSPIHWRHGMKNCNSFFKGLSDDMPTNWLRKTQEVLTTRRCLEIQFKAELANRGNNCPEQGQIRYHRRYRNHDTHVEKK